MLRETNSIQFLQKNVMIDCIKSLPQINQYHVSHHTFDKTISDFVI